MTYRELMEKIIDMAPNARDLEVLAFNNDHINIEVYDLVRSRTEYYLEINDIDFGKNEVDRLMNIIDNALDELGRA